MIEMPEPGFAQQDLDDLERVQALAVAFQRLIANLDANEQHDDYNERFNRIRFDAMAILRKNGFDINVPRAVSKRVLAERGQNVATRLSGIVIFGVVLALVGLGVNSIILEDFLINSVGCLVSSGGMLLVIGAFAVWGVINTRHQLTNMGDLYLRCDTLIQELNQVLSAAIPDYASRAEVEVPSIPSAVGLAIDSLEKQAADWQKKLETLKQQRLMLGQNEPPELTTNYNFVLRELDRIEYELANLNQRGDLPFAVTQEPVPVAAVELPSDPPQPEPPPDSGAIKVARAHTQEIPVVDREPDTTPEPKAEEKDSTSPD